MQWLRRSDANSRSNVRPAAGVPDHRAANSEKEATLTKQANEEVKSVTDSDAKPTRKRGPYAVYTPEVPAKIGRFAIYNGNAQAVRAFPGVTESTVRYLKKQYLAAAGPTGGHVTQLEHHRRGRPVLLGTVVDQQV